MAETAMGERPALPPCHSTIVSAAPSARKFFSPFRIGCHYRLGNAEAFSIGVSRGVVTRDRQAIVRYDLATHRPVF